MEWLGALLTRYPELAVYLALGLGYWIGGFRVGAFSLGGITGSLLAGIFIGWAFEVPVSVAKIQLDSAGKGKGTFTDPNVGPFTVKIKVRDNGKASGTITPTGLCGGKVTFSAKPK